MYRSNNLHIVGISGSLRSGSYNRALLVEAAELLPEGVTFEIVDLHDIPMFNADEEATAVPEAVLAFRAKLKQADAFVIATPEYNFSIPGVLKNAIDWASRSKPDGVSPLEGKPVAIIGAGGMLGTVRAQMHLREVLGHNDLKVLNKPSLMVARAGMYFDEDGRLTDPMLRERLEKVLLGLRDWTRLFQPVAVETDLRA